MPKYILENKFINIDNNDFQAVLDALEARQLAGTAQVVTAYEQKLADYFKVKHALAVSSGTAALHLLLYLYDVRPGDEVILPPTAPIMSALPIVAVGARPVFADVTGEDFSFDPVDLSKKITKRTKAIISVPMWGYPTHMDEVILLAERHGIPIIEDASHCHGARNDGHYVGAMGDVGFFSTQERKLVATGEGGFILTDNDDVANRVREIRDFGKPFRETAGLRDHLGQYGYLFGLNFRLAALSAALGTSQLHKLDRKIAVRTAHAARIRKALADMPWLRELSIAPPFTPNYYSLVCFVQHDSVSADSLAKRLYEQGIVSDTYRFGIKPLYELPIFKGFRSACPKATALLRQIITLPTHEGLSAADIKRIVTAVRELA